MIREHQCRGAECYRPERQLRGVRTMIGYRGKHTPGTSMAE
jgi:hypothetical protein